MSKRLHSHLVEISSEKNPPAAFRVISYAPKRRILQLREYFYTEAKEITPSEFISFLARWPEVKGVEFPLD